MVRTCPSASNNLRLRQLSALILLISLISTSICALAQTKEQQKRGIIVPPAPTPSPGSIKFDNPGNKPELILQTGHTRSINAVAFSPDNRWLARGPRVRLSAETVRDQALAVSGLLSKKMYGPPVRPPQPKLGLNAAFGGSTDWKTSEGDDRYRRAIYVTWRRSNPYPSSALGSVGRCVNGLRRRLRSRE